MTDNSNDAEKKLEKLGDRVRSGWKSMHQISDKTRDAVRSAVKADWDKTKSQAASPSKEGGEDRSPTKSKDHGNDQSHGH